MSVLLGVLTPPFSACSGLVVFVLVCLWACSGLPVWLLVLTWPGVVFGTWLWSGLVMVPGLVLARYLVPGSFITSFLVLVLICLGHGSGLVSSFGPVWLWF